MDKNMVYFNQIQMNRNQMRQTIWKKRNENLQQKETSLERKINHVMELARECGATEETPLLWLGVLKIIQSESVMNFFIKSKPEGRMTIVKHYTGVNH
jgi:hypothetical protein